MDYLNDQSVKNRVKMLLKEIVDLENQKKTISEDISELKKVLKEEGVTPACVNKAISMHIKANSKQEEERYDEAQGLLSLLIDA